MITPMERTDPFDDLAIERWTARLRPALRERTFLFRKSSGEGRKKKGKQIERIVRRELGARVERIEHLKRGKTGNDSFRLRLRDRSLKCYECWTPEYARKIRDLTETLLKQGVSMPRILATSGRFVVSDWTEGETLTIDAVKSDGALVDRLVRYQADIHRCSIPSTLVDGWKEDHYLMYIFVRFLLYGRAHFAGEELMGIVRDVYARRPEFSLRVTHPDFTVQNIVRTSDDRLMIVDNETLNVDRGYEYDLLNAKTLLFEGDRKGQDGYLESYARYGDLGTLTSHTGFWDRLWTVRLAGSYFQMGLVEAGLRIVDELRSNPKTLDGRR